MDSGHLLPSRRAQSSVIGIVLIIGLTLAAASAVVVFGSSAIDDGRQESRIGQAEQAMTQFDSRAAQVALGESDVQTVRLGGGSSGQYQTDTDAGRLTLIHKNDSGPGTEEIIHNSSLGEFTFELGDTEIAYQGGGVWRTNGDGSTMVSPPEFHYRSGTLTLPIIRVSGEESGAGNVHARVENRDSIQVFPNSTRSYNVSGDPYRNPLEQGELYVEIESQYCQGWQSYFESRTEGAIVEWCTEGEQSRVRLDLSVVFEQGFQNEVVVTSNYVQNGNGDEPNWTQTSRPSASDDVDDEIEGCSSGCDDLPSPLDSEIDNGTYFADDDVELDGATFDTDDGNITLVIDGDLTIKGDNEIKDNGRVRVFLKGDYQLQGTFNEGGDATQLQIFVHSSADEITHNGNTHLTGIVYAPNTYVSQQGSGVVKGAMIGEVVEVNGNPSNSFEVDSSLSDYRLEIVSGETPLTFLHITENEIQVDLK